MNTGQAQLRARLERICRNWLSQGLPSREGLIGTADTLSQWKQDHQISGIWRRCPLMLTATLDDGLGQGLHINVAYFIEFLLKRPSP